jgi:ureidoacrylate peracid hydrolase
MIGHAGNVVEHPRPVADDMPNVFAPACRHFSFIRPSAMLCQKTRLSSGVTLKGRNFMSVAETDFELAARVAHVEPLVSIERKVRPGHTALLVIDMQNDFIAPNGLVGRSGRDVSAAQKLAERLPKFIAAAREAGVFVIFVRNVYTTERNFYLSDSWLEQGARKQSGGFTRFPVCAEGSWEGDYYGDVRPLPGDPIVTKHRYNAFHNTDLEMMLRARAIRTVVATGVATDVCVGSTAREAFMRDYYSIMVADGTATWTQEDQDAALLNFDRYFGEVSTIAEISAIWARQNYRGEPIDREPASALPDK